MFFGVSHLVSDVSVILIECRLVHATCVRRACSLVGSWLTDRLWRFACQPDFPIYFSLKYYFILFLLFSVEEMLKYSVQNFELHFSNCSSVCCFCWYNCCCLCAVVLPIATLLQPPLSLLLNFCLYICSCLLLLLLLFYYFFNFSISLSFGLFC